jgi:signal transduction histidine kinase
MKTKNLKNLPFYLTLIFIICQLGFAVYAILSVPINAIYQYTIITCLTALVFFSIIFMLLYRMNQKNFLLLKSSNTALRRMSESISTYCAEQVDVLSRHLLAVSEQEKASLARELHDELGSQLIAIRINLLLTLDKLEQYSSIDPDLATHLHEALLLLKRTVDIKRRIIENLRPSVLENFGLAASIRSYCEEIMGYSDMRVDIKIDNGPIQVDPARSIAIYRIVQEAITNIVKYANATHVSILLKQLERGIRLCILDNGKGIPQEVLKKPKSHGILGMRERAVLNGGSFTISANKKGRGTRIDVFIPYVDIESASAI